LDLVLVRVGSCWRAYEGRCPHQGALLGEGELDGGALVCRNHRWRFDAETGRRKGGEQCLRACPVEERAGDLFVDVSELRTAAHRAAARRRLEDLPRPPGLPLLGNFLQLDLTRLHQVLEGWGARYGTLFTFQAGPRRLLVVSEPSLIERILRGRPESYRRLATIEPVFAEMGVAGVFSVEGAAWRPQRRLVVEALSPKYLRGFYPTLALIAERFRRRLSAAASARKEIEIAEDLKRFTVDVATFLAFGYDINSIEREGDIISKRLDLVFPAFNRRLNALVPYWRWFRLPADRKLDRALVELRTWLSEVIGEVRRKMAAEPERAQRPTNLLEAMLAARDESGAPFSDETLFGNAMTMLLGGEDTTASTLAWAVHELCGSPEATRALQAELDHTLGDAAVPPDVECTERLAYTAAIANEVMRLRPVAPLFFMEANEDVVLADVAVPKGTPIVVLSRPGVLDEKNFAAPKVFRPERWLGGPASGAHEAGAHMPFGSGPRICPGRSLALLEMRVALAMLYKNFEVERVADAGAVREHFSFTMAPQGLTVRLRPRG
jgi:cytochrome P450/nitrite reductase/ring-hydroxylating ferredoxin subunit